ncbi:MAG: NAD(P)/FAD-dependent oxidoreductase [Bacteroidota bacterium]|jgi:predicted Rossmann fold flavoprotein
MKVAIIGGGAAGFFAALSARYHDPSSDIIILERSAKVLSKVKISGGGRCNVTNACFDNRRLAAHYPRGENFLKKAFEQFSAVSTVEWFEKRGVRLKTYPDNCMFPVSNDSQTIINCFVQEAVSGKITVKTNAPIRRIAICEVGFSLRLDEEELYADRVIVAIGGQPKMSGLVWLSDLGHTIIPPVPSLFTFNMPDNPIRELMGNVVENVTVRVEGTKLKGNGPLLITHWGMSGPAILQLSAWGARILSEKEYNFAILVNWLNEQTEEQVRSVLHTSVRDHAAKMMVNLNPFPVTGKLWQHLLWRSGIPEDLRWKDLQGKNLNKLANTLINDRYSVTGKTTFKEEFVTAGGVSLLEVDVRTMQSKIIPGLFFAGEVMDIDGITGGFNFQAAWTTGWIAGKSVSLNA